MSYVIKGDLLSILLVDALGNQRLIMMRFYLSNFCQQHSRSRKYLNAMQHKLANMEASQRSAQSAGVEFGRIIILPFHQAYTADSERIPHVYMSSES